MKKILIFLSIVIGMILLTEIAVRILSDSVSSDNSIFSKDRCRGYLIEQSNEDLIVLGSSVAKNSFKTAEMEDSLRITAFNGGAEGEWLPYHLSVLESVLERHRPKAVILAMMPEGFTNSGLGPKFNRLRSFYDRGSRRLDERLQSMSIADRHMLKFALWRYGGVRLQGLIPNIRHIRPEIEIDRGYEPNPVRPWHPKKATYRPLPITTERIGQLDSIVNLCNRSGVRLILAFPPQYRKRDGRSPVEEHMLQRAKRGDFLFWNDTYSTPLSADSSLFLDNIHLNDAGATIYTDTIIRRLRNLLDGIELDSDEDLAPGTAFIISHPGKPARTMIRGK